MKVINIENSARRSLINQKNNELSANNKKNYSGAMSKDTSFTGGVDMLIKFWEGVDRGGLAASFTVQDMLGTNIPRTLAARNIGKEYNGGKTNWTAVMENALREFLTGPSMFAVPAAVLYGTMKAGGKAHGVPIESIRDFGNILASSANEMDASSLEAFKKTFYTNVFGSVFSNFDSKNDIILDDYVQKVLEMEKANKKGLFKNIFGKSDPTSKEELLQNIMDAFVKNKKANTKGYPDFLTAKITKKSSEVEFAKILDRMDKFAQDFFKTLKKSDTPEQISEAFVKNFSNKRMGGRFVTNATMGAFTAAAMWFIPKIYTIGKANPETAPLKEWSSGLQNQMQEGAVVPEDKNDEASQVPAPNTNPQSGSQPRGQENAESGKEVSFSGGGISRFVADLGEKVSPDAGTKLSKLAGNIESDWINVARPVFLTLITGFTLVPRIIQSAKRDMKTSKEKNDKNEWTETKNILRRDVTTIITILFAMKGLNSIMAHNATKKTGTVLTNKVLPDKMNPFKKFAEFFNSEGGVKVLSDKQNASRLSYFADADQVGRLFEDTEAKKGSLYKMLHIDAKPKKGEQSLLYDAAKKLFGEKLVDNKNVSADDLKEVLHKMEGTDELKNFMNILNDKKTNPLLKFASATNSIFQTLSLGIVAGFLGFGLPKINNAINTSNELKKLNRMKKEYQNTTVEIPHSNFIRTLKPQEKEAFQCFLGNIK